jgi:predicted O-methyltransferase YrrM
LHNTAVFVLILLAAVSIIALSTILVSLYTLHKVRRVHIKLFDLAVAFEKKGDQLFRQVEALGGLYLDLQFARALPPTRGWAASPDFLSILARHAREQRPELVVECGSGVSTLILARCMQLNGQGRVVSLDHDPQFAEQTRRNLAQHGLSEWAEVIHAPIREHVLGNERWNWYDLHKLTGARIDMLVVDGPPMPLGKMARYPAGPMLLPLLSPTGVVFLDDTNREDEQRTIERWMQESPGFRVEKIDCEKGCVLMRRGVG